MHIDGQNRNYKVLGYGPTPGNRITYAKARVLEIESKVGH